MIAICPNPFRDVGLKLTKKTAEMLADNGFESIICPFFYDEAPDEIPNDISIVPLSDASEYISLAVVLGGDGTILAAVRAMHGRTVPILGVNMGNKGFMTSIDPEDIDLVVDAAKGLLQNSRRMMLDVTVTKEGKDTLNERALNDAVIHGYGDCISISALCDGKTMTSFSGDGVVLATPSGSTGYSMSAGGPIVEPEAEAMVFSPICAHSMTYRSFVIGPERVVQLVPGKIHSRKAYLAIDGRQVCDIENGDIVTVRRSESYVEMVEKKERNFFETTYKKLI